MDTPEKENLTPEETAGVDTHTSVLDKISQKLEKNEVVENKEESEKPKAIDPTFIDFSKLTKEQIQALQRQFQNTPFNLDKENQKPTLTLRKYDDKLIVSFGKARLQKTENEFGQTVYRQFLPVQFEDGSEELIPYRDFMNSERVQCEIVDTKVRKEKTVTGETMSREKNKMVETYYITEHYSFVIKLPSGKEIEIEGEYVNG